MDTRRQFGAISPPPTLRANKLAARAAVRLQKRNNRPYNYKPERLLLLLQLLHRCASVPNDEKFPLQKATSRASEMA